MGKYYIDFNTGAGNEYAETLEDAKEIADDGAAYTQQNITIHPVINGKVDFDSTVTMRCWYGVAYDENKAYEENPICFGDFGYYADWTD